MQETARRPGRPRDPQVIERDELVYQVITKGTASRSELAAATGLDRLTVAQCCSRLRKAGRIRHCPRNGGIGWAVNDGTPCP